MSLNLDAAGIESLFSDLLSIARQLKGFNRCIGHEPISNPGLGFSLALWWSDITPVKELSGLAAVSARVEIRARIYKSLELGTSAELDKVDPALLARTCLVLAALCGRFTLGGDVMSVDLLGANGTPLRAQSGYVQFPDGKFCRTSDITLPVTMDDVFTEVP